MARKMKDSGIEWIGEIPEDWRVVKVKRKYTNNKRIVGENAEQFDRLALTLNGVIKRSKNDSGGLQPERFEGYQILNSNELVFKLIDLENVKTSRVGLSPYTGIVSPAYITLTNPQESKYGYYYFMNMWYQEIFNGLGNTGVRSSISPTELLDLPYIELPAIEKEKIVNFLDKQTSIIDSIIEDTKQSIRELNQYKHSIITETVTKGLYNSLNTKNTDIDWMKDINKTFSVVRLGSICTIGSGGTPDRGKSEYWNNGSIPWMSSGEINKEFIYDTDEKITEEGLKNSNAKILPVNTVMLGLIGQGKTKGLSAILCIESACNQNLGYIIPENSLLHYKYLFYCLKASYSYIRSVIGESQAGIYLPFIRSFKIPLPTLEVQQEIIKFLDNKVLRIDALIMGKEQLISEYESFKKSLIYEYVTGKKEVM